MSILRNMMERRSWDPLDDRWYVREWNGLKYIVSSSGVIIDEASSLTIVAVYACVNLISNDISTLPLPVYQHNRPRSKMRADEHPLYRILHDEPNEEQTSAVWRQTMMVHALLWGNAYSEIEFGRDGMPKALWPLPTWRVYPRRTEKRELFYEIRLNPDYRGNSSEEIASYHGDWKKLPPYAVFHIPALSISGISGLSPVKQAMQAMGLAKAAEEFGARFFGSGANPSAVIKHPGIFESKESHERTQDKLRQAFEGLGKSHHLMLLDEAMEFERITIPPNEAQFLETRKFQRSEIASMFRVPPHMIGDVEKSTSWGTGIEQQSIGYVQHTLRPWLVLWEQEIKRKLFFGDDEHFAEFVVEGLLRGDAKARSTFYHNALLDGWLNRDEVREKENYNPIPNGLGQIYYQPANMKAASKIGESQKENNSQRSTEEIVKLIAEREKANLLKATKREPEGFREWLEDFYRDFADWILKQAELVMGSKAASFMVNYVSRSKQILAGIEANELNEILEDWEERRTADITT